MAIKLTSNGGSINFTNTTKTPQILKDDNGSIKINKNAGDIRLQDMAGDINLIKQFLKGDDGGYYIPEIDDSGVLSWSASEADMPEVESVDMSSIFATTTEIHNAIVEEAAQRVEADNNLKKDIEAEITRANAAETINAEAIADLQIEDININNKIAEETRLREEEHIAIKEDCKKENDEIKILLGEEKDRAVGAETALQDAIKAEAAIREAEIKAAIEAIPDVDLTDYAKKEDIPVNVSELVNDSGYLIEHQSLDNYATKKDVTDAIDAIPDVDFTGLATENYVDEKVASIVDTAPEALNTLNELSAALGDDPNFATTVSNEIGKKVDKVDGKGLTTNDFTDDYKNKLDGVAANANKYTHPETHPASMISGLSAVATSGNYNDLSNKPSAYTHPEKHPASMISGLASVATSGSYNDLSNKPTIPSAYTHPSTHPATMITGLSTVATSGSYNDLSNKPTIPSAYTHPSTHPASMITGLASVATSGNYNDLSNKPISSGTLTAPLKVTGGDSATAGKLILDEKNNGQITNSDTSTLFGFLNSSDLSVGSTSYNLKLRGKATKPQYNGNDLALYSDIPSNVDSVDGYHITVTSSAPSTNNTSLITIVL